MLRLLDALYCFDYEGDLTAYLQPEEREDYQMASRHQREATRELTQALTGRERALLESLLRNQEETREEEARLSFRRGLILGLRLGALGSAR